MKISPYGLSFIKKHEGFVGRVYKDPVGVLTIGYGLTSYSQAFMKWWEMFKGGRPNRDSTITEKEASDALEFVIKNEYGAFVNMYLGHVSVPQHVFDAMVSVVFNTGPGALNWKWAKAVKAGDYVEAAKLLENTAVTGKNPQTGRRKKLPGLVRRRKEEALLLRNGVYTGVTMLSERPKPPVDVAKPDIKPEPPRTVWDILFDFLARLFNRSKP